jgi:hypothetical protein
MAKLSWIEKKVIKQAAGTRRGEAVIKFAESGGIECIVEAANQDWAGVWENLPAEAKQKIYRIISDELVEQLAGSDPATIDFPGLLGLTETENNEL